MTGTSTSTRAASSGGGVVYGLGLVGALVYYWQHAGGFWPHVGAVLQALVWPAFVVYDLLRHLRG